MMRKSKIEHRFDETRSDCEMEGGFRGSPQLCNSMNCLCARIVLADWTRDVYNKYYRDVPSCFCTAYFDRDAVQWYNAAAPSLRSIKARFQRFLRKVGLGNARIFAVLDACLIVTYGVTGPLNKRWCYHWHFFLALSDFSMDVRKRIKARVERERVAGPKPFMAKKITKPDFWTPYLWKPLPMLSRKLRRADGKLISKKGWVAKGKYLKPIGDFMNQNTGPSWVYAQGFRRNSHCLASSKCVQQEPLNRQKAR